MWSGQLLVSVWVSHCATPMVASFVVLWWTSRQFMDSVASGVLNVNHAMQRLMLSPRELCHEPRSPPRWSPLVSRSDGKRPNGLTIAPWKSGRMLVWGVSCTDTFAASHLAQDVTEARAVAGLAELRKRSKYEIIVWTHHFDLVVVETSGAFGTEAWTCSQRSAGRSAQPHRRSGPGPSFSSRCP